MSLSESDIELDEESYLKAMDDREPITLSDDTLFLVRDDDIYLPDEEEEKKPSRSMILLPEEDVEETVQIHTGYTDTVYPKGSPYKEIYIVTDAGKPVVIRHPSDHISGPVAGIVNYILNTNITSEVSRPCYMIAGDVKIVFANKNRLFCLIVSAYRNENVSQLLSQLEFVFLQVVMILSESRFRILDKNPGFMLCNYLTGMEAALHSMMNDFATDPAYLLHSIPVLRMAPSLRAKIHVVMRDAILASLSSRHSAQDVKDQIVFGFLFSHKQLVTIVQPSSCSLLSDELIVLINFVTSLSSLRKAASWTPITLPLLAPMNILYACISFISADVCVVLAFAQPGHIDLMQRAYSIIQNELQVGGYLLTGVQEASSQILTVNAIDPNFAGLLHFVYKTISDFSFYVAPVPDPVFNRSDEAKESLLRLYRRVHSQMHERKSVLNYFEARECETLVGWISPMKFELYCVFSPFITKTEVVSISNKLLKWISREESALFIPELLK